MSRKHVFPIVVMLAAAFVAGLLAIARTVALGRPANAATASDPAIAFRLKELDRFERSLRLQLARSAKAQHPTVYRHAAPVSPASTYGEDNRQEDDDRDD